MRAQAIRGSVGQYGETTTEPFITGRRAYYILKRILDVTLALVLLVLALPIMIIASIAIFVYSPGPIFFIRERVGAKRHTRANVTTWEPANFRCLKFRTMKCSTGPSVHKASMDPLLQPKEKDMQLPAADRNFTDDSRVIGPGRILRKLSIDELPQLFNVLRGDMSLIGPRPALPYELEMYKPWHMLRLQAQPGITGLQQVSARSTADFDEQVKLDLDYIAYQSIWLDLKIALRTPLAVLFARGAY